MNKQDNTETFKDGFKPNVGEFVVIDLSYSKGMIVKVLPYSERCNRYNYVALDVDDEDRDVEGFTASLEDIRPLRPDEVANGEHAKQFVGRWVRRTEKSGIDDKTPYMLEEWVQARGDAKNKSWAGRYATSPKSFRNGCVELLPLDHEAEQVEPENTEAFKGGFKPGDVVDCEYGGRGTVVTRELFETKWSIKLKDDFVPIDFGANGILQSPFESLTKIKDEPKKADTPTTEQEAVQEARGHHKKRKEWYDFLDSLCASADTPVRTVPKDYDYLVALSRDVSENAIIDEWKI